MDFLECYSKTTYSDYMPGAAIQGVRSFSLVGQWVGGLLGTLDGDDDMHFTRLIRSLSLDIYQHTENGSIRGTAEDRVRQTKAAALEGTAVDVASIMIHTFWSEDNTPDILEGVYNAASDSISGLIQSCILAQPVNFFLRRRTPVTVLFPIHRSGGGIGIPNLWRWAIQNTIRRRCFDEDYIHERRNRHQEITSMAIMLEEDSTTATPWTWARLQSITSVDDAQYWSMAASFQFVRQIRQYVAQDPELRSDVLTLDILAPLIATHVAIRIFKVLRVRGLCVLNAWTRRAMFVPVLLWTSVGFASNPGTISASSKTIAVRLPMRHLIIYSNSACQSRSGGFISGIEGLNLLSRIYRRTFSL